MNNFTTNTYEMKREILKFSEKISKNLKYKMIDEHLFLCYYLSNTRKCFLFGFL